MAVYVDSAEIPYGRLKMNHMFSPNTEELHKMADLIGIKRKWFQDPERMRKVSWPHYDVSITKRDLAVSMGAILVDKYQFVAMANHIKLVNDLSNRNPLATFTGNPSKLDEMGLFLFEHVGINYYDRLERGLNMYQPYLPGLGF